MLKKFLEKNMSLFFYANESTLFVQLKCESSNNKPTKWESFSKLKMMEGKYALVKSFAVIRKK